MKTRGPESARSMFHHRDGAGHIDPAYALALRPGSRVDAEPNALAFLHRAGSGDALAEQLGEGVVEAATSGEDTGEDNRDRVVLEEAGGPFVVTKSNEEYAYGIDARSPTGSSREPFPTTSRRVRWPGVNLLPH